MELDLFGTPPAPNPEPRIWSVAEITRSVRAILEGALGEVWVEGEICNFRRQASGHCYFGLKDERALLSCVLFRSSVPARFELGDGMLVHARGRITVYEARGQYQLNVSTVQPAGAGQLLARIEALKRKLDAEGLFDPARKRPIPRDPRAIGLVTSPTGAALQDFLNIAQRRAPWVRLILNPVRVQGSGAAEEIAAAIGEFNAPPLRGQVDLLILCRGGGSIEDLQPFNEEVVARAIVASGIPVVSAVGHEIDFTIADLAADLRAPTPSAAAELALPDREALRRHGAAARARLGRSIEAMLGALRRRIEAAAGAAFYRAPRRMLEERTQRLDAVAVRFESVRAAALGSRRAQVAALLARLRHHRPDYLLALRRVALEARRGRFAAAARGMMERKTAQLARARELMRILSPQGTLSRGYSITFAPDGSILRLAAAVNPGDSVRTLLPDGSFNSQVILGGASRHPLQNPASSSTRPRKPRRSGH